MKNVAIVILIALLLTACAPAEPENLMKGLNPKDFCVNDIVEVYSCDDGAIKTVHGLLGGGATWIVPEGRITCPDVAPDAMSAACKELMENPPSCQLVTSCDYVPKEPTQPELTQELTTCTDPRPEMCTMEYVPVCGERMDGTTKTYGNGCSACGDNEVVSWTAGACSTTDEAFIACDEPRPELCTKEYRPVCAKVDTGVRCITTPCPSTEWQTKSNACTACSDTSVLGYQEGACPLECDEGQDKYGSQTGPACVTSYTRDDIGFWKRCATDEDCADNEPCAYTLRTTKGEVIEYTSIPEDKHGMPETALRCVPEDYATYLLHTTGLAGVDKNGKFYEMIA